MILQKVFILLNLFIVFSFIILLYIFSQFFKETNIRRKFFLFLIIFIFLSFLGFYYNIDGVILLFIVSELSIILIYITMFSQLYSFSKKQIKYFSNFIIVILITLNLYYYDVTIINYNNFFCFQIIQLNDFIYFYSYFFEKQLMVTILVIYIMTFYSIFFILLYFNIKKKESIESLKYKKLYILRKQNILHQSNYFSKIRIFQK